MGQKFLCPHYREQIIVEESVNATLACDDAQFKPFNILEPKSLLVTLGDGICFFVHVHW